MGRPLFSSPAVRVEPEQPAQHPTLEKWTYWKPFDPDSDEFFDNCIEERFLDPAQVQPQADVTRAASPIGEDSSSSEGSSSGRASPAGDDDVEDEAEVEVEGDSEAPVAVVSYLTQEMTAHAPAPEGDRAEEASPPPLPATNHDEIDVYRLPNNGQAIRRFNNYLVSTRIDDQSSRSRSPPGEMFGRDTRRTSPMPIPRPVTPPSYSSYNWGSPSPVGSTTPRNFFTWSTLNSTGSFNGRRIWEDRDTVRTPITNITPSVATRNG